MARFKNRRNRLPIHFGPIYGGWEIRVTDTDPTKIIDLLARLSGAGLIEPFSHGVASYATVAEQEIYDWDVMEITSNTLHDFITSHSQFSFGLKPRMDLRGPNIEWDAPRSQVVTRDLGPGNISDLEAFLRS